MNNNKVKIVNIEDYIIDPCYSTSFDFDYRNLSPYVKKLIIENDIVSQFVVSLLSVNGFMEEDAVKAELEKHKEVLNLAKDLNLVFTSNATEIFLTDISLLLYVGIGDTYKVYCHFTYDRVPGKHNSLAGAYPVFNTVGFETTDISYLRELYETVHSHPMPLFPLPLGKKCIMYTPANDKHALDLDRLIDVREHGYEGHILTNGEAAVLAAIINYIKKITD